MRSVWLAVTVISIGCGGSSSVSDGGHGGGAAAGGGTGGAGATCGDGVVQTSELCDTAIDAGTGACPTTCPAAQVCTTVRLNAPGTCNAACIVAPITDAVNGDGCCPPGKTFAEDSDCAKPGLTVQVDPATVTPELGTTTSMVMTVTPTQGFTGHVTLLAVVLDAGTATLTGWNLGVTPAAVDLTADGGAVTAQATLSLPSRNTGLSALLGFYAQSTAPAVTANARAQVTVINRYTLDVDVMSGGHSCTYPVPNTVTTTVGTELAFLNTSTDSSNLIVHTTDQGTGCPHENTGGVSSTPPGQAYTCTPNATGTIEWGCHTASTDHANTITVVAP